MIYYYMADDTESEAAHLGCLLAERLLEVGPPVVAVSEDGRAPSSFMCSLPVVRADEAGPAEAVFTVDAEAVARARERFGGMVFHYDIAHGAWRGEDEAAIDVGLSLGRFAFYDGRPKFDDVACGPGGEAGPAWEELQHAVEAVEWLTVPAHHELATAQNLHTAGVCVCRGVPSGVNLDALYGMAAGCAVLVVGDDASPTVRHGENAWCVEGGKAAEELAWLVAEEQKLLRVRLRDGARATAAAYTGGMHRRLLRSRLAGPLAEVLS